LRKYTKTNKSTHPEASGGQGREVEARKHNILMIKKREEREREREENV